MTDTDDDLAGLWWTWRADGAEHPDGGITHWMGGRDAEPDWAVWEEAADYYEEPVEVIAERFVPALWGDDVAVTNGGQSMFLLERRVRWFGGTDHEWAANNFAAGSLPNEDTRWICELCGIDKTETGPAPYDEKCRPPE